MLSHSPNNSRVTKVYVSGATREGTYCSLYLFIVGHVRDEY